MAPLDAPLDSSWVAAIHRSSDDFAPLGAGLVIGDARVLTCSHVVSALGPDDDIWVAFPKADPPTMERRRVCRRVRAEPLFVVDASVLHLGQPVPVGVRAPRLRCPKPEALREERWWAFGFPRSDPFGNSADGAVGETLGYGWVRLDSDSRYLVERGFSGGGLWCPRYEAVVGLVGQANDRGDGRALTFDWLDGQLPAEKIRVLAGWWAGDAGEVALAAWGWRLAADPEARRHWRPRARGVAVDSERGFRFRGRRRALQEVVAWLDRPYPDRRVLVITGSPGVGKSALLGRVVTTADTDLRHLLPPEDDGVKAAEGSVACAVHAKGKTAFEVATEIARAASAELPLLLEDVASFLRAALEQRKASRFNVVIDALDEAETPGEARLIVEKVTLPLVETCADIGVQVVVGSRRHDGAGHLLDAFGAAAATIDLDRTEYFALDDLAAYALASLQLAGDEREDNPYANSSVAEPVARRIAQLADRNFLVAGLVARDHGLHDTEAIHPDDLTFTSSVEAALTRFVERVPRLRRLSHEFALGALAFAEAPGFSARLWTIVIGALAGTAVTDEEVQGFAHSSAANFLVEHGEGADGPTFRLFHQALNNALLARRRTTHGVAFDESAITRALLAHGQSVGWGAAPEYLRRSLPAHAARAGLIDELLADDGYLLRADLLRLLPAAHQAASTLGRQRTRLLLLTPETVRADPPGRAALLSVTNAIEGLDAEIGPVRQQPYRGRWAATRRRAELATLEGHIGSVTSLCAFEVEGRTLLASAGDDATVRLWDPASGQPLATMEGHTDWIRSICAVEVEGQTLLASAGDDTTVRLWDPATGQPLATMEGHTDWIRSICAVEVDGQTLLASAGDDTTVRLWDPINGQPLTTLKSHTGVRAVCSLNVGGRTFLASAGDDATVRLWDPPKGQIVAILEGHSDWIRSICAVEVEGRTLLASAGDDALVRLWNPANGQIVAILEGHTGAARSVCALQMRGRTVLASGGDDATVRLWNPANGQAVATLEGHTGINCVCVLKVGGRALLGSGSGDRMVRLWEPASGQAVATVDHHIGVSSVCALEADGRTLLVSGGSDRMVRLWDAASGQAVATLEGHNDSVSSVCALEMGGRMLVGSGSSDRTVRLWDPASGQAVASLEGHADWVNSVFGLELGGRRLLTSASSDRTVRLWDPTNGQTLATLQGHTGSVNSVFGLELGGRTLLASASSDRTVRLWDPTNGQTLATLQGHSGPVNSLCALEISGRTLLVSGSDDATVRLWDPANGQAVATLKGHSGPVNSLCALEIGGRTLIASGSDDATVRLWDPANGRAESVVPVRHWVSSVAAVRGGLAVGLSAGILVLDIPAIPSGEF